MLAAPTGALEDPPRRDRGASPPLSVERTDNRRRVRDGYIRSGTVGHARARATRREAAICRTNVLAMVRACTRVPPQNFHGKEGVDGSSPSEGFSDLQDFFGPALRTAV